MKINWKDYVLSLFIIFFLTVLWSIKAEYTGPNLVFVPSIFGLLYYFWKNKMGWKENAIISVFFGISIPLIMTVLSLLNHQPIDVGITASFIAVFTLWCLIFGQASRRLFEIWNFKLFSEEKPKKK